MMASAQVVETSVNTNNSPSQDYTTNLDDHSNHKIDSPGFKPFTVIIIIKEEVIGIFFFNIWWLLKELFCWWFLKTSVVPLTIYPDSPPLVEGDHLVQAL